MSQLELILRVQGCAQQGLCKDCAFHMETWGLAAMEVDFLRELAGPSVNACGYEGEDCEQWVELSRA